MSRALPLPSDDDCRKDEIEFKEFISQKAPPAGGKNLFVKEFFRYSEKRVKRFKRRMDKIPLNKPDISSSAACKGFSRKDGGRVKHFQEFCVKVKSTWKMVDGYLENHDPNIDTRKLKQNDWDMIRRAIQFSSDHVSKNSIYKDDFSENIAFFEKYVEYCMDTCNDGDSEYIAVKTHGLKIRGVTKNNPSRVVLAHLYRNKLFRIATTCRGTREALSDTPIVLSFGPRSEAQYYSIDLTKASDGLKLSWISRLCEIFELPPELVYDFSVDGIEVKRGLFMGMPLTWPLLTITHYLICSFVDPKGFWYLKGDDLVCYWTEIMFYRYKVLLRVVGLILNEKKTFVSKNHATFCEGFYRSFKHELRLVPNYPLRGLIHKPRDGQFIENCSNLAWSFVRRGLNRHKSFGLLELCYSYELAKFRKSGIQLFYPQYLGGLGLPPLDTEVKLTKGISRYVQGIYLGVYQAKKLYIAPSSGPNVKFFFENYVNKIRYSYAVPKKERCNHIDSIIGEKTKRASANDSFFSPKQIKKASLSVQARKLRQQLAFIKKTVKRRPVESYDMTIESSYDLFNRLWPVPSTLNEIFNHRCGG